MQCLLQDIFNEGKIIIEKTDFFRETILCAVIFSLNESYFKIKKVLSQNEPKHTRIEYFLTHRESWSLRFLLLWQVNLYSNQVNSCQIWAFFLILRIRNLQYCRTNNVENMSRYGIAFSLLVSVFSLEQLLLV